MAAWRHRTCIVLASLLIAYTTATSPSNENDPEVRSCLSNLFSCFPSDYSDPSTATCSGVYNASCGAHCPEDGQTFYNNLWSSKSDMLSRKCDEKYCFGKLYDCLGADVLHYSYSHMDWSGACSAWKEKSSCVLKVNETCTDSEIFNRFYGLFTYGCVNDDSKSYLANISVCFPYSFFDISEYPQTTDICQSGSTASFCTSDIQPPLDMDASAQSFFNSLTEEYYAICDREPACKSIMYECLSGYIDQNLPSKLLLQLICSNIDDLDKCVKNDLFECDYSDDVKTYLHNSCSGIVCNAALESCYNSNVEPFDYSSGSSTVITNFCSVSGNITACLDEYKTSCDASGNSDAALRSNLTELCNGNSVTGADQCYWTALQCFYQYFPTLTKPSSLWTSNSDDTFCSNINATSSCLNNAGSSCTDSNGKYTSAINNIVSVINYQCASVCSEEKATVCQDAMTYYMTQLLTNSTSGGGVCGILAQQQSCYATLTKKCSGTTNPVLNVAVMNSITNAIEMSACSFNTTPTIPPGCSMPDVVGYFVAFLNQIYLVADMSADNYSFICMQFTTYKDSLLLAANDCSGGIDERIRVIVAGIESVVTNLCNGQCPMDGIAYYINQINIEVQAAIYYTLPVDYRGHPRPKFCRHDDDGQETCHDYTFYFATICVKIDAAINYIAEHMSGCGDTINTSERESVKITAGIYYELCKTEEYTCDVQTGSTCFHSFSNVIVYYPLMNSHDKFIACRMASEYVDCIFTNLVQCSPYFYFDTYLLVEAWYQEMACTPPTVFDNVNTSQSLNITNYPPSCGADMITFYIEMLLQTVISYSVDITGNSDELYSQYTEIEIRITAIFQSYSSSGQCSVYIQEMTLIWEIIEIMIIRIHNDKPDCYLQDAYSCVSSLEVYVRQRGLKRPKCGCGGGGSEDANTEFCSLTRAAFACVSASTLSCPDKVVTQVYSLLLEIQESTGMTCIRPCDSAPCQHGGICSDSTDGTYYQCQCPTGYSGKNCEHDECKKVDIFACFKTVVQSLIKMNYVTYCKEIVEAKACIELKTTNCPGAYYDIATEVLIELSTNLTSHCDTSVPPPSPDCEAIAVECLSAQIEQSSVTVFDDEYGGFTENMCSMYAAIQACIVQTCPGVQVAIQSVFSFLCTSFTYSPCKYQMLARDSEDLQYSYWRANEKQPRPMKKDVKSPEENGLDDMCTCKQKQKDKPEPPQRHPRNEDDKSNKDKNKPNKDKNKPNKDKNNDDDNEDDNSDYSDYECWYVEQQRNRTRQAAYDCPSMTVDIEQMIKDLEKRYMNDSQCSNPCADNQCQNFGTCIPDGYGYTCQCLPGYSGTFCQTQNTTVTQCNSSSSLDCLISIKTLITSMATGPYSSVQCNVLYEKIACLAGTYISCDNDANNANFQIMNFIFEMLVVTCRKQTTVVKTCEVQAAISCTLDLLTGIIEESDTYCSLLEVTYECASMISISCPTTSEVSTQFVSESFAAYSLICSTTDCSISTAIACLNELYEKIQYNTGDGSVCDTAASVTECVTESVTSCDLYVQSRVFAVYSSYMEIVVLQCSDACSYEPCMNGGTCTRTYSGDGYTCSCTKDYGGNNCGSPITCDSWSIEVCIQATSGLFVSLYDACHTTDCSFITQLTACLNSHSSMCTSAKKTVISSAVSALLQLQSMSVCTSKTLSCNQLKSCQMDNITMIGSQYIIEALLEVTSEIGFSYEKICGSFNSTVSILAQLTDSSSGCSSSYVSVIKILINWMSTISGKNCYNPTTCQADQANSCIDNYNKKVDDVKKKVSCPIRQRKEMDKLEQEKNKCVEDNSKKCDSKTKDEIDKKNNESKNNTTGTGVNPHPCSTNPCKDNATCDEKSNGKFECGCPRESNGKNPKNKDKMDKNGNNCKKEPDCKLNEAIDCVTSIENYVEVKGLAGKKLSSDEQKDFCVKAKKAQDCVIKATAHCSSDLSSDVLTNLYGVQASVGYTCYGYCSAYPCKNGGACKESDTPASYPAEIVLPKNGYTCNCSKGHSGPNCDTTLCSDAVINMCFVDILVAVIQGKSKGLCDGSLISTMVACVNAAVQDCPSGKHAIILKLSSMIQTAFQGTICPVTSGTCNHATLTSQCFSEVSHISVPIYNNDTQSADDNYCRKLTLVNSCQISGCKSVITIVQKLFEWLCISPPSGLRNITEIIIKIEEILNKLNQTDESKQPPKDRNPPPPDTSTIIIIIDVLIKIEIIYIDGVPQTPRPGPCHKESVVVVPSTASVIAIQASADKEGKVAGILASGTDDILVSGPLWKCSSVYIERYMETDFIEIGMSPAVLVNEDDLKMHDRCSDISPRAKYIWTAKKKSNFYDHTVYCRAVIPPKTNRTSPEQPPSDDNPDDNDNCWHLQNDIDKINKMQNDNSSDFDETVQDSIDNMTRDYNASKKCEKPCDRHQCKNSAKCSPRGYGYDCKCLPGFIGPHCQKAPECNIPKGKNCIGRLKDFAGQILTAQKIDWRPDICSKSEFLAIYECISINLYSCSESSQLMFEMLIVFFDYVQTTCDNQPKEPNPPRVPCEVSGLLRCAFEMMANLYETSNGDVCGTLSLAYECVAQVHESCPNASDQIAEQRFSAYEVLEMQCPQPTCSVSNSIQCIDQFYNDYDYAMPGDTSVCSLTIKTETCVSTYITSCDTFIRGRIDTMKTEAFTKSDILSQCVSVCDVSYCQHYGICEADAMGYSCNCISPYTGHYCQDTTNCSLEEIRLRLELSLYVILSSLLDSCGSTFSCSYRSSLTADITGYSSSCNGTTKSGFDVFVSAINAVTCGSTYESCDTPEPRCQYQDIYQCSLKMFEILIAEYTNPGGPNYASICREYNLTMSCFASVSCSQEPYSSDRQRMLSFFQQITGSRCSNPICDTAVAVSCLATLNTTITSLMNPVTGQISPVMCTCDRKRICGSIDASVECIKGGLSNCPSGPDSDRIIQQMNYDISLVFGVCPLPCQSHPCQPNGKCIQTTYNQYQCECPDGSMSGTDCNKVPTCDTNSAYVCLETLQNYLYYNGIVNPTPAYLSTLPPDFSTTYCNMVIYAQECFSSYILTCDGDTRERVYSLFYELQAYVDVVCVTQCSSNPCQNDGICSDVSTETYSCECGPGFNGTDCEQDLCPLEDVSYVFWQMLKLTITSFGEVCSYLDLSITRIDTLTVHCNSGITDITNTVLVDFVNAITPLCSGNPPGNTPHCNFLSLSVDCFEVFQSMLIYFDNPNEQQAAIICEIFDARIGCITTIRSTGQCVDVIVALEEIFGYLCVSIPSNTTENPPSSNTTTCDIHETVNGMDNLEKHAFKAHKNRPPKDKKKPPSSVEKSKKYEMQPVERKPPQHDDCQDVQDDIDEINYSSGNCSESISNSGSETIQNVTNEYLGDGQCDNPCEPNPCANLGICVKREEYGYMCYCQPGFTGRNCETGGECDESSAYTFCFSDIDQYITDSNSHQTLCRKVSGVYDCLSENMLSCGNTYNEVIFQLVIIFIDAVYGNCANDTTPTINTCEYQEVYKANHYLLKTVYEYLSQSNPEPYICKVITVYQQMIENITVTCNGEVTELSQTIMEKTYGAQDLMCQNPNCSISTANDCIMEIYEITSGGSQYNDSCEMIWKYQECVQESTSECNDELQETTEAAVRQLIEESVVRCKNPCDTLPCRHNGTCRQTGVDSYECICPKGYTGKQCEIDTGCNLLEVNNCFTGVIEVIVDLLLDPCYTIPVNCSLLASFNTCVNNYSKECDDSTSKRLHTVESTVANISSGCNVARPSPPDCDIPPEECKVQQIELCTETFLEVIFSEYSYEGGPDYGRICSEFNLTISCFDQYSKKCSSDYQQSVLITEQFLLSLTGKQCNQTVCFPETSTTTLTYIKTEIEIYSARPGPIPDSDHTEFCFNMKEAVKKVEGNLMQCANGSETDITSELITVKQNISYTCPYPCDSHPCLNGSVCTETSYKDYTCQCQEGYGGKNCSQVIPYPYKNHSTVNCHGQDRSMRTLLVRLTMSHTIFCDKFSSVYISENGYISYSDNTVITNFAKFCRNEHILLAPLFAGQDCSCPNSNIYYHEYFASGSDADQEKYLSRATDYVREYSSSASDFTATALFVVTWENMMPYPCAIFQGIYGVTEGSTYQLVFITDFVRAYAQFIYLKVNVQFQVPFVYSGYNDLDGRCINSIQSGTNAMDHFENVPSRSSGDNSWLYPLFDSCESQPPNPEGKCLKWAGSAIDLNDYELDSCPCSSRYAAADPRYHFQYIDWFRYCYATNRVQLIKTPSGTQRARVQQVCCYDPFNNGTLLTLPPFAGFPVITDSDVSTVNDSQAHLYCCVMSKQYCNMFLALRPTGFCNSYTAPIEALLWGDPHFITVDNFTYTCNPIGEFTLLKTVDGTFNFQARISQYTDASGKALRASIISSLAAKEAGEAKVEVALNPARNGLELYVNGSQKLQNSLQTYYGNVYVSWSGGSINVTFPSGWTMTTRAAFRGLSFIHTVPNAYTRKTMGLLGNFNGNPDDDLTTPNGVILPKNSSNQDIHYKFCLTWQISANESLFTYPPNRTAESFINSSFVPAFDPPCTDAEKIEAVNTCGSNKFCYFDYCVTKDAALAMNTKNTVADYSNNLQLLGNQAPQLTIVGLTPNLAGQYVISVTLNVPVTFTLKAVSPQNLSVNYYMAGNITLQKTAAVLDASSGIFKWTPTTLSIYDVGFIAVDSKGDVSSKLQVVVNMCSGCSGNGACNFASYTYLGNGTNYQLADCNCDVGWTGPTCAQDFDGCASMPCGPNNTAACTDLTPDMQLRTQQAYVCTSCPPGYYSSQCIDLDECAKGVARCKQTCINTVGSYLCGCNKGYRLSGDNYTCTDISECQEGTSSCSQVCTNTIGSFTCSCYPGYQGANCDPVAPCGTNSCAYKCNLVNNNPVCTCQLGYQLGSDGHSCTDINECNNDASNSCSYKLGCVNTPGSFECSCPAGLLVGQDRRTCQDCPAGYWGVNCSNICDCNLHVKQCDKTSGCTICQSGWTGTDCDNDIDECVTPGLAKCPPDSSCVNVPGAYTCPCNDLSKTNPDKTCGNNQLTFKLKLDMEWKDDYLDLNYAQTNAMKILLEAQLTKIFATVPNFVNVDIRQFFKSSVGIVFDVYFNTALSQQRKVAVGQTLVQNLVDNSWKLKSALGPTDIIEVPTMDYGNSSDLLAGDPCLNNYMCKNGGTCIPNGYALPTCSCPDGTSTSCLSNNTKPNESSSLSTAQKIGLGVGIPLGILAIIALIVLIVGLFYFKRQRGRKVPFESSEMMGYDDNSLHRHDKPDFHKYDQQPVRYHPKWPFSAGPELRLSGYEQTDT